MSLSLSFCYVTVIVFLLVLFDSEGCSASSYDSRERSQIHVQSAAKAETAEVRQQP